MTAYVLTFDYTKRLGNEPSQVVFTTDDAEQRATAFAEHVVKTAACAFSMAQSSVDGRNVYAYTLSNDGKVFLKLVAKPVDETPIEGWMS